MKYKNIYKVAEYKVAASTLEVNEEEEFKRVPALWEVKVYIPVKDYFESIEIISSMIGESIANLCLTVVDPGQLAEGILADFNTSETNLISKIEVGSYGQKILIEV